MAGVEKLPLKKVKARMKVMKVSPYKDSMIYIRKIDNDMFEYLVCWQGQIYADYVIFTPDQGRKNLTKEQEQGAFSIILTAATTTVDMLRGEGVKGAEAEQAAEVVDAFFPNENKKETPAKLPN